MEMEIPEADPVALARMKYELENQQKAGVWAMLSESSSAVPDTRMAAKSGTPTYGAGRAGDSG
jgi:outer membrane protein assembly factor BamD